MAESDNNNLIGFIAGTVEIMRDDIATMREQMATKSDLSQLENRFNDKLDASTTAIRGDIEQVHLRV